MVGDDEPTFAQLANSLTKNETPKKAEEKQSEVSEGVSQNPDVTNAALWLSRNRDAVVGPVIPFLRQRFNLNILDAIDAAKTAHALQFAGVVR